MGSSPCPLPPCPPPPCLPPTRSTLTHPKHTCVLQVPHQDAQVRLVLQKGQDCVVAGGGGGGGGVHGLHHGARQRVTRAGRACSKGEGGRRKTACTAAAGSARQREGGAEAGRSAWRWGEGAGGEVRHAWGGVGLGEGVKNVCVLAEDWRCHASASPPRWSCTALHKPASLPLSVGCAARPHLRPRPFP